MTDKSEPKTPHLAITSLDGQGGAANKRNKTLLMKSAGEVTEAVKSVLKELGIDAPEVDKQVTEKASFETKRSALTEALKGFSNREYAWVYVSDFDDTHVVFSIGEGVFVTSYTEANGIISVGEEAVEVTRQLSYVDANNTVLFNEGSLKAEATVKTLIQKSLGDLSTHTETVQVLKKFEKEVEMEKELEQAQADLAASQAELAVAQKALKDLQDTLVANTQTQREEKLKAFISDEAELKATMDTLLGASDAVFQTVLKGYSASAQAVASSDLMKTVSEKGASTSQPATKTTAEILAARYNAN